MKTKEIIINEIKELVKTGRNMLYHEAFIQKQLSKEQIDELKTKNDYIKYTEEYSSLKNSYQKWYTKSLAVIKQTLPDRYNEFIAYYTIDKRKDINYLNYTISDYLLGVSITRGFEEVINPFSAFLSKFENQISILASVNSRITSILNDIEGILQSNLFDSELEISKDLLKKKHIRVAGVLSGVVLESHLSKVCNNHLIKFRKKNPTISDFNEELKKSNLIDIATWRLIQRLGDIRNLSAHPKERDPKIDEIEDLIRGTEKLIAELI